jgi:hypothetical protein
MKIRPKYPKLFPIYQCVAQWLQDISERCEMPDNDIDW